MKMLHVVIFFVLLCKMANAGTLIFSDNFDDGTAVGWTLSNAALSTDVAESGSYSIKGIHSGTVVVSHAIPVTASDKEVTIEYDLYYSSTWPANGGGVDSGLKFGRLIGPGQEIQIEIYQNGGGGSATEPLAVRPYIYGNTDDGTCTRGPSIYGGSAPFNRGTWNHVKIHYILNDEGQANGSLDVSWNGTVISSQTGITLRCSASSYYNEFRAPNNIGDTSALAITYTDNFKIWLGTPLAEATFTGTITGTVQ